MYKESFLILIIIIIILFTFNIKDNTKYVEAFNGKYYKIRIRDNKEENQKYSNFIAKLDDNCRFIIDEMVKNSIPNKEISLRLYNRFKNKEIRETPSNDSSAAYTINKGHIWICCEKDGKMNDFNDSMFVLLHELAHIMSNNYGHGKEFQVNFSAIVKYAVKLDKYKPVKYEENNTTFCGVNITTGPCSNNECNKLELDEYFKETLL